MGGGDHVAQWINDPHSLCASLILSIREAESESSNPVSEYETLERNCPYNGAGNMRMSVTWLQLSFGNPILQAGTSRESIAVPLVRDNLIVQSTCRKISPCGDSNLRRSG
jgi:hypothetical protein